ncbi:MAG: hypothetical protein ABIR32_11420 [Ilumatobacteraceae bacterium]
MSADAKVIALEPDDSIVTQPRASNRSGRRTPLHRVFRVATNPVGSMWPQATVDEWGRAPGLIDALAPLAHLRWDVSVGGAQLLPKSGAALIVINTRRMALTPLSTALALGQELDRPVRFVGRPDTVPFGPFLRRIGGLLAQPDEIQGALRAGQVVLIGARSTTNPRHAGAVDHALIAPAIRENVPVHVAATLSTSFNRSARVEVGGALRAGRQRRGPLAEVELAEMAQRRLQDLLDEMGGARSGISALNWFREG